MIQPAEMEPYKSKVAEDNMKPAVYHTGLHMAIKLEVEDPDEQNDVDETCSTSLVSQGADFGVTPEAAIKLEMSTDCVTDQTESKNNKIEEEERDPHSCLWCPYVNNIRKRVQHMKVRHKKKFSIMLEDLHTKWKTGSYLSATQKTLYFACVVDTTKSTGGGGESSSLAVGGDTHTEYYLRADNYLITPVYSKSGKIGPADGSGNAGTLTTSITEEKPFKCDVCGRGFKTSAYLKRHRKTHAKEKPFKCYICFRSFSERRQCVAHMLLHDGEKPYKCDLCGKGFSQKVHCFSHIRQHKEKPYECDVCGKGYRANCDLRRHKITHTTQKPYRCDICGRGFTQKAHCIAHVLLHNREKPFKCNVCGKGYTRKAKCTAHEKKHNLDKPYMWVEWQGS